MVIDVFGNMRRWKCLLIAIALLLAFSFVVFITDGAMKVPFWVMALFPNSISFWLVFRCPEQPLLNAILFMLVFLALGAAAVGVERIIVAGVEPSQFSAAILMFWSAGLLILLPGLLVGLLLRWLWPE